MRWEDRGESDTGGGGPVQEQEKGGAGEEKGVT